MHSASLRRFRAGRSTAPIPAASPEPSDIPPRARCTPFGSALRAATFLVAAVLVVVGPTGCGDDNGTAPHEERLYSREELYPIGLGYSWTYVSFDSAGAARDTATIVVQADSTDGETHWVTKCWLEGQGLCPMEEIVTASAVQRDLPGLGFCDIHRFPMTPGRTWEISDALLVRVVAAGDMDLRTGHSFQDVVAVEFRDLQLRTDEQGNELPPDTVLTESDYYAAGWGCVATQSFHFFTGRPSSRSEILERSFR